MKYQDSIELSYMLLLTLQCLFSWDHVIHTIVPINGKQELETAYMENIEGVSMKSHGVCRLCAP